MSAITKGQALEMWRMAMAEAGFHAVDARIEVGDACEPFLGESFMSVAPGDDRQNRAGYKAMELVRTSVGRPRYKRCFDCWKASGYKRKIVGAPCAHCEVST